MTTGSRKAHEAALGKTIEAALRSGVSPADLAVELIRAGHAEANRRALLLLDEVSRKEFGYAASKTQPSEAAVAVERGREYECALRARNAITNALGAGADPFALLVAIGSQAARTATEPADEEIRAGIRAELYRYGRPPSWPGTLAGAGGKNRFIAPEEE